MKRATSIVVLCLAAAFAGAQTTTWLSWGNSDSQFDLCWTAAGYTAAQALSPVEKDLIRANVQAKLDVIYAGTLVSFLTSQPVSGDYHRLIYGNTTTQSGLFGQAQRLDWRNAFKNDSADIYVRNFSGLISAANFSRSENIERLSNGLAGTSAHELGHNLGLQHYDDYGDPAITPATYANTGGIQNTHIMATGATGLSSNQRAGMRSFSQMELVKLEYGDQLTGGTGTTVNETGASHGSQATAQMVAGSFLPLSQTFAVNINGSLATGTQDWYGFQAAAGSLFTANILARDVGLTSTLNSILTLYDSSGVQLRTNDNISFSGNTIFGTGTYGQDSMLLNIPLATTGTYFVRVNSASTAGNYNLLMYGMVPVPEPTAVIALGIGIAALIRRRRA